MASISDDPNGRRRILFVAPDGSRKTLRLGKIDRKSAEAINRHVESLLSSKIGGQPIPRETATWLTGIGESLRDKLVAVGLVQTVSGINGTKLGEFLSAYMAKRTDIKPASLLAVEQVVRNLTTYYGVDRHISSITAGEAEDFKRWLTSDARTRGGVQEKTPGLSPATVAKRLQRSSAIFNDAYKRKLISENPFAGIKQPKSTNPARQAYVPVELIERLIEQAPSVEWRLLLAMSRYLGVRVPSEPFSMTWDCVDWERSRIRIPSPKTEVHGKNFRVVPLLPDVKQHLEEAFEQATVGSIYIFERLRARDSVKYAEKGFWMNLNLRQQLLRMLTRAGIKPWPRLWHNLRASAQTDLANRFPIHVVCEWLGNTKAVAQDHYLQVTDAHFNAAETGGAFSGALNAQKPAQQAAAGNSKEVQSSTETNEPQGFMQSPAVPCDILHNRLVAAVGFEPTTSRLMQLIKHHKYRRFLRFQSILGTYLAPTWHL